MKKAQVEIKDIIIISLLIVLTVVTIFSAMRDISYMKLKEQLNESKSISCQSHIACSDLANMKLDIINENLQSITEDTATIRHECNLTK